MTVGWRVRRCFTAAVRLGACGLALGWAALQVVSCSPSGPAQAPEPTAPQRRFSVFSDRMPATTSAPEPASSSTGPSVVLVVLDTTRADRIGRGRGDCEATPRFDELAETGLVFRNAASTSSWTLPAHASLFTGKYVYQHGVRWRSDRTAEIPEAGGYCSRLRDEEWTLAEVFRAAGMATIGVASNYWLTPNMGFAQGFEEYAVAGEGSGAKKYLIGAEITNEAIRMLRAHRADRFFLFVNLMDAHAPYAPAEDAICFSRGLPLAADADNPLFTGDIYGSGLRQMVNLEGFVASRQLREYLLALYDDEIRYLDRQVGAIFDALREMGRADDTIFVVVGDHGEYFFEHGLVNHGIGVYEAVARVPLLIRFPASVPRGVVEERVELIDLYPTLIQLAGIPVDSASRPAPRFSVNILDAEARHNGRAALIETYRNPWEEETARQEVLHTSRAVVLDGLKLIVVSDGAGENEFFDLREDPDEKRNLIEEASWADLRKRLELELERLSSGETASASERAPELGPGDVERLKKLGYLGSD